MAPLALVHEQISFWWITLGLGFVVILVVIVLLSLLVSLVVDIDRNVRITWETATRVARNTATTWMLQQTTVITGQLEQETGRHAVLMAQKAGAR